jgi:sirohydrochlorin cobaltochelatase
LREAVLARERDRDVRLAFLEFMFPDLGKAIDAAVSAGAQAVEVVPVFLAQGGHVKREVPELLAAARQRHPAVTIALRAAVGEADRVIAAMADVVVKPD